MDKNIRKKFEKIKLLILDVDGVLTRGEIIYDNEGRELKAFNVKDGLGIFLLGTLGIPTILLTARASSVVERRARDMRVAEVIGGILPKVKVLDRIKKKYRVKEDQLCFVGDDLIDIGVMKKVGLPIAVGDAPLEVKKSAVYITKNHGGQGAVREVVELILKARKLWNGLIENFDQIVKK